MTDRVIRKLVAIKDVMCLSVPPQIDPLDPVQHPGLEAGLAKIAHAAVLDQYKDDPDPPAIPTIEMQWLVTSDIEEAKEFQPDHDCPRCRAGTDQATAYLREHPGRFIALGNLSYDEVWYVND